MLDSVYIGAEIKKIEIYQKGNTVEKGILDMKYCRRG